MRALTYFFAGVLFGVGLVVSGMTQPSKVVGFLDVTGDWDPSLVLVMVSAIGVHSMAYRIRTGRKSPYLTSSFRVPTNRIISARLLGGAVLFGVGWGLAGYCPGPAISSLVALHDETLIFVASMAATMFLYDIIVRKQSEESGRVRLRED